MKFIDSKKAKITLLTLEQAKKLPRGILNCGEWWWLQSAGYDRDYVAGVGNDGFIDDDGYGILDDRTAIRPAFRITNLDSKFGEKVCVGKLLCTVISKNLVLADECVCDYYFDSKSNNWKTSELKTFIESEEFYNQYLQPNSTDIDTVIKAISPLIENKIFSKPIQQHFINVVAVLVTQKNYMLKLKK